MRILEIGTDAIGYRLKEKVGSVEVLSDTLGRIAEGEIVIEPVLAKRLVERPRGDRKEVVDTLSPRELDVLRLVADGYDTHEIALRLAYSERTIKAILHDVTTRLHLRNRAHAVAFLIRRGLL
jgi:DNA-binding NarL/FixJ family response regulator